MIPNGGRNKRIISELARAERGFYATKYRAKRKGLEFSLDRGAVLKMFEATHCPICKVAFTLYNVDTQRIQASRSLDRVDNTRGYTPDNTAVICRQCNSQKGAASAAYLRQIADWMERFQS